MNYSIEMNGTLIELPKYTISVMEKIEQLEKSSNSSASAKSKLQTMYNFLCDLVGKDKIVEVIGKFNDADSNNINITYLSIVREYNKPLNDYEMSEGLEQIKELNNSDIAKLGETISKLEGVALKVQAKHK
jgi:hypothetical protein